MLNCVETWQGSIEAHQERISYKLKLIREVEGLLRAFPAEHTLLERVITQLDSDKLRACNARFDITHPLEVSLLFAEYFPNYDPSEIVATVAHDLAEDKKLSLQALRATLGKNISEVVWRLTKKEGQSINEYRDGIKVASEEGCHSTAPIKAVDTLHNSRSLAYFRQDKQFRKAMEYLENAQMFREVALIWGYKNPRSWALLKICKEIRRNCLNVLGGH
jgi:(p)ppGpp synthase/HD superfamily hydrolase